MTESLVRRLGALVAVIVTAGLVAACGGDGDGGDTLSQEEFSREISQATQQVTEQFQNQLGPVFNTLERLGVDENDPVPDRVEGEVQQALDAVAQAERQAADEVAALNAPENARDARDQFVDAVNEQADQLEQLAQQEQVRVGELADATEMPEEVRQALQDLRDQGFDIQLPEGVEAPEQTTP